MCLGGALQQQAGGAVQGGCGEGGRSTGACVEAALQKSAEAGDGTAAVCELGFQASLAVRAARQGCCHVTSRKDAQLNPSCPALPQTGEAAVGQTGRVLLQEAAVRDEGAAHDEGSDVHPLWGQREDKQVQVGRYKRARSCDQPRRLWTCYRLRQRHACPFTAA